MGVGDNFAHAQFLPRPVLRERVGVRVIFPSTAEFTLTLSRSTRRGDGKDGADSR
jgi:hypothetical protein